MIGHGEGGADLAARVVSEIRAWEATGGNDAPEPGFRMAVVDSRDLLTADDVRFVVDKPYSRLASPCLLCRSAAVRTLVRSGLQRRRSQGKRDRASP